MAKLTRSQKKGKCSSYTNRFLKKCIEVSAYPREEKMFTVKKLIHSKKTNAIMMKLEGDSSKKEYFFSAPSKVFQGQKISIGHVDDAAYTKLIDQLKNYKVGDYVCNVESKKHTNKIYFRTAGNTAKVQEISDSKVLLSVKDRIITLKPNCLAMRGRINREDILLKPIGLAGVASKIAYAKGKKYPTVSASAMNAQEHLLGGSYKKSRGRPMCVRRGAPPGQKYGCIAPKRTGRAKR